MWFVVTVSVLAFVGLLSRFIYMREKYPALMTEEEGYAEIAATPDDYDHQTVARRRDPSWSEE